MPTGYTAGILDGKVKTFQQFAAQCIRAFGSAIHMRDEPWDKKYTPRKPSDYHSKAIAEAEKLLKKYANCSDKEIIDLRSGQLETDRRYHLNKIKEIEENFKKLNNILQEARDYTPPTSEHTGIKDFMIEQLRETIKYDGSTDYYDEKIESINKELSNLDPVVIRHKLIEEANHDLQYHKKEYDREVELCNKHNEWAKQFLDSLK